MCVVYKLYACILCIKDNLYVYVMLKKIIYIYIYIYIYKISYEDP